MANNILALGTSISSPVIGNPYGTNYTMADLVDETGLVIAAHGTGYAGTVPTTAAVFQKGCFYIETDRGSSYTNVGTTASPSWHLIY
jgi:hypothetical protein